MGAQLRIRVGGSLVDVPRDVVILVGVGMSGPFRSKLKMPLVLTRVPWVVLHVVTLWTESPEVLQLHTALPTTVLFPYTE